MSGNIVYFVSVFFSITVKNMILRFGDRCLTRTYVVEVQFYVFISSHGDGENHHSVIMHDDLSRDRLIKVMHSVVVSDEMDLETSRRRHDIRHPARHCFGTTSVHN